jgi:nicotinate-nucleotide pyrophosphorylase (carboxylating)
MRPAPALPPDIASTVRRALSEDLGPGDLTADLLPAAQRSTARVLSREAAVLCGTAWFDEVFQQLDAGVEVRWQCRDGDDIAADAIVCRLSGPTRALLTGERTALNFLQLLSGTATATRHALKLLEGTKTRLLDTRKTIPGLRTAQKYAVACGGGTNHRMGLYDAVLIKENHIRAAGGIAAALAAGAKRGRPVEIEVTNLQEFEEALNAGARHLLLDNFGLDMLRAAVTRNAGRAQLEVSGGVTSDSIRALAQTGVDFISMGSLTKHVRAVDYSMQFDT